MKIYNQLEHFLDCLRRWEEVPERARFEAEYIRPIYHLLEPMLSDFSGYRDGAGMHEVLQDLDWKKYRERTLLLDSVFEEQRFKHQLDRVQDLLRKSLQGEAVLFGSFAMMDGYARFNEGSHRVFLGVDENHGKTPYIDILSSHELTHVARESQASVWEGMGLSLSMTHDDFVASQTVLEHLFSEGFSCVVSQLLNPAHGPWDYVYQNKESFHEILGKASVLDQVIHAELTTDSSGRYRVLYRANEYPVPMPRYSHYVWAWAWVSDVLSEYRKDASALVSKCSVEFLESARRFSLVQYAKKNLSQH